MNQITHGVMPGLATPIEKAPGAIITEGLSIYLSNTLYFPTNGSINQAAESMAIAVPSRTSSPHKALPEALRVRFDPADVFSIHSLTHKRQHKAALGGKAK